MTKVEPTQTRLLHELKHNSPLVSCRFDATGPFVFAGAQDNSIQRFEIPGGKKAALNGHKSWVRALVSVPRNQLFTVMARASRSLRIASPSCQNSL